MASHESIQHSRCTYFCTITNQDEDVLTDWKDGKDTEWPRRPSYRFVVGERVECRIGPHPVKGWAAGRVVALNYTQPGWPPGSYAPYQIWLHDGRLIFAPQDNDNVIRLRAPADATSPPSPPLPADLQDSGDGDEEEEDDEDMDAVDFQGADEADADK